MAGDLNTSPARRSWAFPCCTFPSSTDRTGCRCPPRGVIAIGQFACGIITVSQFGLGVVSISQFTVAGYALAQFAFAYSLIAQLGIYIHEGHGQLVRSLSELMGLF
jgi:hypothetical protein